MKFHFDETESRHILKVLRKKVGDTLQIFDGEGTVYPARISDCSNPKQVEGEIISATVADLGELDRADGRVVLAVYPTVLKGPRFDWLLEKATELGVASIHPVTTERALIKMSPADIVTKHHRWQKIALAAAKQCGRAELPALDTVSSFSQAILRVPADAINLILWEREKKTLLSGILAGIPKKGSIRINLFTGPEGGFTLSEIEAARKADFTTVLLGPCVLRAETAALAAISRILF